MPKLLDPEVEGAIKALSKEKCTHRIIHLKLKAMGYSVSLSSISRVLNNVGKAREAKVNQIKIKLYQRQRTSRTPVVVQKVKQMISKQNPPTQEMMAIRTNVSRTTIRNVIKDELGMKIKKKVKVHTLTEPQKANRKTNSRKLYENHLAGDKSEFVVTLDEAWLYINECTSTREICYVKQGQTLPGDWVLQCKENFPKGFMVVAALSGRGPLKLIRVSHKAKINGEYYRDNVLKPILEQEVPLLYPEDLNQVFLHHDKSSSHTSRIVQQYLEEIHQKLGINYIKNNEIPTKSPDISPLDFYGFGFLKQRLKNRRPRSIEGLWKAAKEEWSRISVQDVTKVYESWKKRCRIVNKRDGEHIEGIKKIHKRSLCKKL